MTDPRGVVARTRRSGTGSGSGDRAGDAGSAVVEFVTLAVLMLVPLVYLVVVLARLQAGAFAVQAAASAAARAYTAAPQQSVGAGRARDAVALALGDQGFDAGPGVVVTTTCEQDPCLQPQGRVAVRVRLEVVLPGVPAVVDRVVPVRLPVEAESVAVVDRFTARPVGQGA